MFIRVVITCALGTSCLLAWGDSEAGAPRLFGRYVGQAMVSTSPYYPPGIYPAEAMVAQTASGIVGYVNIVFDPQDLLGGTITHAFSAPIAGESRQPNLRYSDRICGAGDPIGKCYPHYSSGFTQYSFEGASSFVAGALVLAQPSILPNLPYAAVLPFDSVQMTRTANEPRAGFDGVYSNLEYVWMGTLLVPTPLPLFGNNQVHIQNGEIVQWIDTEGNPVSAPGVIGDWCFDDGRRLGWMNQQGAWDYFWVLDPNGQGVGVIVTFDDQPPDCMNLQDPLAGSRLDDVHADLVGVMFELSPLVSGPGVVGGLQVSRNGAMLDLTWGPDCGTGNKYGVYRGDLAAGYGSLAPVNCSVVGSNASIPVGTGAAEFFLIVPNRQNAEGSYGLDSRNIRRPAASNPCRPQGAVDSCAP